MKSLLLSLVCVLAREPYGASLSSAREVQLAEFVRWMRSMGVRLSEHVTVSSVDAVGFGVVSTSPIAKGEIIMAAPVKALITSSMWTIDEKVQMTATDKLCMVLLRERQKAELSPWFEYFEMLPQSYTLPAYWSDEQLRWLEGSYAYMLAIDERNFAKSFIERVRMRSSRAGQDSEQDVLWALATVKTRALLIGGPSYNVDPPSMDMVPFLAPGVDLINHHPTAEFDWFLDSLKRILPGMDQKRGLHAKLQGPHFKIHTLKEIARGGEELFIQYGENSGNADLLTRYGFVVPKNPYSSLPITLGFREDDPHRPAKEELRALTMPSTKRQQCAVSMLGHVPVCLVQMARLNSLSDPATIERFLQRARAAPAHAAAAISTSFYTSRESEVQVLSDIQSTMHTLLRGYPTTADQDKEILDIAEDSEKPASSKAVASAAATIANDRGGIFRSIVVCRLEEKQALQQALMRLAKWRQSIENGNAERIEEVLSISMEVPLHTEKRYKQQKQRKKAKRKGRREGKKDRKRKDRTQKMTKNEL